MKTGPLQKIIREPPRHCMPLSELVTKATDLSSKLQATAAQRQTEKQTERQTAKLIERPTDVSLLATALG